MIKSTHINVEFSGKKEDLDHLIKKINMPKSPLSYTFSQINSAQIKSNQLFLYNHLYKIKGEIKNSSIEFELKPHPLILIFLVIAFIIPCLPLIGENVTINDVHHAPVSLRLETIFTLLLICAIPVLGFFFIKKQLIINLKKLFY